MEDYIPFYGTDYPELFEIERKAMDRDGKVISNLNYMLPKGRVLDIGAGNGFTANRLVQEDRHITCLEPSPTLPNFKLDVSWVKATAESMPFHDGYFHGAYATWAYFLPGVDKQKGLEEAKRVVCRGGSIIIVDNLGKDEFTSFAKKNIVTDGQFYKDNGFESQIVETSFRFDTLEEAEKLMTAFFGKEAMAGNLKLEYQFKVVIYELIIGRTPPPGDWARRMRDCRC